MEMRQRQMLEFRTPQHPALKANNWGGASPFLARDIPQESLEQRYRNLIAVVQDDSPPPMMKNDCFDFETSKVEASPRFKTPSTPKRMGLLWKFMWHSSKKKKKQSDTSCSSSAAKKKMSSSPRWNPKKKWPNGWY